MRTPWWRLARWIVVILVFAVVSVVSFVLFATNKTAVSGAKQLEAHGVASKIDSVVDVKTIPGSTKCYLDRVTVRFSVKGAAHTAKLAQADVSAIQGSESSCDRIVEAAKQRYAPSTPLLVDPLDLTHVEAKVDADAKSKSNQVGTIFIAAGVAAALITIGLTVYVLRSLKHR